MSQKRNGDLGSYVGRYGPFAKFVFSRDYLSQLNFILGRFVMNFREVTFVRDKDKDGVLPRSEYMEFGCRGVHHTYIHNT